MEPTWTKNGTLRPSPVLLVKFSHYHTQKLVIVYFIQRQAKSKLDIFFLYRTLHILVETFRRQKAHYQNNKSSFAHYHNGHVAQKLVTKTGDVHVRRKLTITRNWWWISRELQKWEPKKSPRLRGLKFS